MCIFFGFYSTKKMGAKHSKENIIHETTKMVANVFVSSMLDCSSEAKQNQTIELTCDPPPTCRYEDVASGVYKYELCTIDVNNNLVTPTTALSGSYKIIGPYEDNNSCYECLQGILDERIAPNTGKYNLQALQWEKGNKVKMNWGIDDDYSDAIRKAINCGIKNCKACVVNDLSQDFIVNGTLTCDSFNNVQNNITQKLASQIEQKLIDNKDLLAGFVKIFSGRSTQKLSMNIATRITSNISDVNLDSVRTEIEQHQTIEMKFSGGDTVTGISQKSSVDIVQNFLSKNNVLNNVLSEAEFKIISDVVSNTNTVDTLGNTVVKVAKLVKRLVKNIVGIILIVIVGLIGLIFVVIIVLLITRLIQRRFAQVRKKKQFQQKLQ